MNNEIYYSNKIYQTNQEIENIQSDIYSLQKDLENLLEFQTNHNHSTNKLYESINQRKYKYINFPISSKETKFFSQYKEYMISNLNGNEIQKIFSQKENEKNIISLKIREVEENINNLIHRKYLLEQELSNLNYLLKKEKMNNE